MDLKFEQKMKGPWIEVLISLLVKNWLKEFRQKLSSHFLTLFDKLLMLHYRYIHWLTIRLCSIRQKLLFESGGFNSDYLQSEIIIDPEKLIHFILFLNYAETLDSNIESLSSIVY